MKLSDDHPKSGRESSEESDAPDSSRRKPRRGGSGRPEDEAEQNSSRRREGPPGEAARAPVGRQDIRPAGGTHSPMSEGEVHTWHQIHTRDMWRIFRIMSEFVDGFDKLSRLGPCVSVFGSSRTEPGGPYYELGVDIGRLLVEHEYGVITGGGPGIMEAANKGAREGGGMSIGLNIVVPHEQEGNPFVDRDKSIDFNFFFVRKVMFVKYAMGFIVLPGGFGTLDELFEALTLIQTGKSTRFPVVLVGKDFWDGLVEWLADSVLGAGNISTDDPDLFSVTDDPLEAVQIIDAFYREHAMVPNF